MTNRRSLEIGNLNLLSLENSRNKSYGFYLGGQTLGESKIASQTFGDPELYSTFKCKAIEEFTKNAEEGSYLKTLRLSLSNINIFQILEGTLTTV